MTLVEVVMAAGVLAVAIMGTMSAWTNSNRLQALQREESIVQEAINKVISEMRETPFTQLPSQQTANPPGFSGGAYSGDVDPDRLLPGKRKLYMGWTGRGIADDSSLRGVKVSPSPFPGAILQGNRYWAPQASTPEMRIILINNEWPTEARMGEEPAYPSDGLDLNGDGQISEAPLPSADSYLVEFGDVDARPLFPRLLAVPVSNPPRAPAQDYVNVTSMVVYPVVVQVRWWSMAGFPREISVITFFTNRAGSTQAASNVGL